MKKFIEKISLKIGLTVTEIKTFIFVLAIFLFGYSANYLKFRFNYVPQKKFDYSFQDSLFKAHLRVKLNSEDFAKKRENLVDSEAELSDFSKRKIDSKNNYQTTLKVHSININEASQSVLTNLPGIGEKTAQKIITFREKKGKFRNLNELLEVKGIGKKKLDLIKKYIFIEN